MRKKEHHPINHLGKMYDVMMLFKPASIKKYKDSHHFSYKIQVIYQHRRLCKEFSASRQAIEKTLQISNHDL
jgi:hypothetical protein